MNDMTRNAGNEQREVRVRAAEAGGAPRMRTEKFTAPDGIHWSVLTEQGELATCLMHPTEGAAENEMRCLIAGDAHTSSEDLTQLARDPVAEVRAAVAWNSNTPPHVQLRLAEDPSVDVRRKLASRHSTPAEVLNRLSVDEDSLVRGEVADNPSAPAEALSRLAGDENDYVRMSVAKNPSAPPEALSRLAADDVLSVCGNVARNPASPAEVLRRLATEAEHKAGFPVLMSVAGNPSAPAEALRVLSSSRSYHVRACVARNPSVPDEVAKRLAADNDFHVRSAASSTLAKREHACDVSGPEDSRYFEVVPPGFDGSTDTTDHLVKWVQADTRAQVEARYQGCKVSELKGVQPHPDDIDEIFSGEDLLEERESSADEELESGISR